MLPAPVACAYGPHPQQRLLLRDAPGTVPWLVFVHGGGWVAGAPEDGLPVLDAAARAGFGAASVGYRLAPGARHPDNARDVATGFAWLLAERGLPPARVVVCGHSAGGHLLFWLAGEGAVARGAGWEPTRVAGLVGLSGVYDLERAGRVAPMARDWVKPTFGGPEAWVAASPVARVAAGLPPVLLINAEQDWGLPRQSDRLAAELAAHEVPVERQRIADRNHLSLLARFGEPGDPAAAAVLAFVRRVTRERGGESA